MNSHRAPLTTGTMLFAGILLSACSGEAINNGPLEGPRTERGDASLCVPLGGADTAFFGEWVVNKGTEPIEFITGTVELASNVQGGKTQFLLVASDLLEGEGVGTFVLPAGGRQEQEYARAVLSRSRELRGAVLAPGETASIVLGMEPARRNISAVVPSTLIKYRVGETTHAERLAIEYVAAPNRC